MAMEGLQEDSGDGSMQCTDHPYKNNTPGGICAFCLQEKLGKLVSSSFPIAVFPSNSSSSSSPSFRSDQFTTTTTTATSCVVAVRTNPSSNLPTTHNHNLPNNHQFNHFRKSRIPFLLTQKKKKKKDPSSASASDHTNSIIFKRSKSSATPRRGVHFLETNDMDDFNPHKRRFWSFLYLSKHPTTKKLPDVKEICYPSSSSSSSTANIGSFSQQRSRERKKEEFVIVEENESPGQVSFDRKVSRSRSVGCGSRSFSGDFFERISTGFGDCTLRRVESHREGKSRARGGVGQDCIKERVKCGGLFSGFMITSSSSSSSSSSNWVSSSTEDNNNNNVNAKPSAGAGAGTAVLAPQPAHGRSKSWGWAFASPMRAFSKPSSAKRGAAAAAAAAANKNVASNLAAIPSLLAVRS